MLINGMQSNIIHSLLNPGFFLADTHGIQFIPDQLISKDIFTTIRASRDQDIYPQKSIPAFAACEC
jgi:hypothetical protein